MTDQIKNFFSTAFSIVAVIAMAIGLYKISQVGLDKCTGYFGVGATFAIVAILIEITRAQNYDGDDF